MATQGRRPTPEVCQVRYLSVSVLSGFIGITWPVLEAICIPTALPVTSGRVRSVVCPLSLMHKVCVCPVK